VRRSVPHNRCTLIAISGIDASGKGFLTARLTQALREQDFHVANINIDGWLTLPQVRFNNANPAEHFYLHAIRFGAMFRDLVSLRSSTFGTPAPKSTRKLGLARNKARARKRPTPAKQRTAWSTKNAGRQGVLNGVKSLAHHGDARDARHVTFAPLFSCAESAKNRTGSGFEQELKRSCVFLLKLYRFIPRSLLR